jgi:hypothetical protein
MNAATIRTGAEKRRVSPATWDDEARAAWKKLIQNEVMKLSRRGVRIRRELLWWASRPEGWTQ